MFDPTTRQKVYDNYSLDEYSYSDIEVVIAKLTELLAEGYTKLNVGADDDGFGNAESTFHAVRTRLENDEEYANRMAFMEANRKRRLQAYAELKEEFEPN